MSLDDESVLSIGTGHFYIATYDAESVVAAPEDLRAPGAGWTEVGHTSLEEILSVSSEGGEPTTLGTLQNKTLRTTYSNRTETFGFNLQQFDADSLKLYYGSNASVGSGGEVQVPVNPIPTVCTFLIAFEDGVNDFGFYVPKAEVFRNEDIALDDTEGLSSLPIAVKPLVHGSNTWTYSVFPAAPNE